MDSAQLTPLAQIMVRSYLDTVVFSRRFTDEHKQPPTVMAKAHYLRSVAQALVVQDDQFELCKEFVEYGKLQIRDRATGMSYLVRSQAAIAIENRNQTELFPRGAVETPVVIVAYRFHSEGLDLAVAGSRLPYGKQRLVHTGPAVPVSTWPYTAIGTRAFDQGQQDPFREVGEIDIDESGDLV